jgi:hypothetical protein
MKRIITTALFILSFFISSAQNPVKIVKFENLTINMGNLKDWKTTMNNPFIVKLESQRSVKLSLLFTGVSVPENIKTAREYRTFKSSELSGGSTSTQSSTKDEAGLIRDSKFEDTTFNEFNAVSRKYWGREEEGEGDFSAIQYSFVYKSFVYEIDVKVSSTGKVNFDELDDKMKGLLESNMQYFKGVFGQIKMQ